MSETVETRTVTVEREIAHPAERIWRALTQPHLIAEWLMANDFVPQVGHRFGLKAEWGELNCEVLEIEAERTLAYRWAGLGLDSVVTWTLTPMDGRTRLTMVQTGFLPEQKLAYHGARAGWPRFLDRLETVLAGLD
jgi:uncharacterized protein YndB with AHSA1/START domain